MGHIHMISQWYTELLHNYVATLGSEKLAVQCDRVVLLHTKETWREELAKTGQAETMVREFMSAVFQSTDDVTQKIKAIAEEDSISTFYVPGSHFSMLHEPNVATLALKM